MDNKSMLWLWRETNLKPTLKKSTTGIPRNDQNVNINTGFLSHRFIVPISIVICNDIMAYLFGFFFGRTPLIKVSQCIRLRIGRLLELLCGSHLFKSNSVSFQLSPKKTWEGFIGGFFSTVVFGFIVSLTTINVEYLKTTRGIMQSLPAVFLCVPVCLPASPVPVLCVSGRVQQRD